MISNIIMYVFMFIFMFQETDYALAGLICTSTMFCLVCIYQVSFMYK